MPHRTENNRLNSTETVKNTGLKCELNPSSLLEDLAAMGFVPHPDQPGVLITKRLAEDITRSLLAKEDDYDDPIGTKKSGFTRASHGPFLCINCCHSDREGESCDHPVVIADPDVTKVDGKAVIDPADCCNYFRTR